MRVSSRRGGWDRDVRLWRVEELNMPVLPHDARTPVGVLAHQTRVTKVKFAGEKDLLATVQSDGVVRVSRVSNVPDSSPIVTIPGGTSVKFVPADARFRAGRYAEHRNHKSDSVPKSVTNDSTETDPWFLVTGSPHFSAKHASPVIHRLRDGSEVARLPKRNGRLIDVAFADNGRSLVTLRSPRGRIFKDGTLGRLQIWSWPGLQCHLGPIQLAAMPRSVSLRPDGNQMAVWCSNGNVLLVDPRTGTVDEEFKTSSKKLSTAFPTGFGKTRYSANGKLLVGWGAGNLGLGHGR